MYWGNNLQTIITRYTQINCAMCKLSNRGPKLLQILLSVSFTKLNNYNIISKIIPTRKICCI